MALLQLLLLFLITVKQSNSQENKNPPAATINKVQQCTPEQGGGMCPLENTCCLIHPHPYHHRDDQSHPSSLWSYQNTTTAKEEEKASLRERSTAYNDMSATSSGCIPSDMGAFVATCCPDSLTGCGVGYQCAYSTTTPVQQTSEEDGEMPPQIRSSTRTPVCMATSHIQDPLVQVLPRYSLCHNSEYSNFQNIWYFRAVQRFHSPTTSMAYYSSHGDIFSNDLPQYKSGEERKKIRMVLMVIHGANRNADDYFCSASVAVTHQQRYQVDEVLLLAPRFVVPSDMPSIINNTVLQWEDTPNGPWRYGASAIFPPSARYHNVSSFDVVDAMLEQAVAVLPHLESIVLFGHSSGGQFVQRYALVSPYDFLSQKATTTDNTNSPNKQLQRISMRAIVANPSSFAYLIPQRYNATSQKWTIPDHHAGNCSGEYNQWEWGLDISRDSTPDYVQRRLRELASKNSRHDTREDAMMTTTHATTDNSTNSTVCIEIPEHHRALVERFLARHVTYLAGSLDRCNVSSSSSSSLLLGTGSSRRAMTNGLLVLIGDPYHSAKIATIRAITSSKKRRRSTSAWCNSHGLEVTCMDNLQGTNRLERHIDYIRMLASLRLSTPNHQASALVQGVGHDHSLMLSSPEGLEALFGRRKKEEEEEESPAAAGA